MCGIFCSISCENEDPEKLYKCIFQEVLSNRGPDSSSTVKSKFANKNKSIFIAGHVLWQQGSQPISQPVQTSHGVLVFNGDIFGGKFKPKESENDTLLLSENLTTCTTIEQVFGNINGPFSFIYFDKTENKIYFGRDRTGRHSLLCVRKSDQFIITSVSKNTISSTIEVPAIGIFYLDLNLDEIFLNPWHDINSMETETLLNNFEKHMGYKININKRIIEDTSITIPQIPEFNFDSFVKNISNLDSIYDELLKIDSVHETVDILINLIQESVKLRVETTPAKCKTCIRETVKNCEHCRVGVLFSGGLDCSILALICDKFLPENIPIDLLNVAFEKVVNNNPANNHRKVEQNPGEIWNVPDRVTGLQTYEELKRLCPNRTWNFVEINVKRDELEKQLENRICHLVFPLKSVLDESLGAALWFAARGTGIVRNKNNSEYLQYTSPCRVLLMGMGADEMFGGYSRHRAAYKRDGWEGLLKILDSDLRKIPYRNLGRDNRVISDNGVQGRTPYLDENILTFTSKLQAYQRCYLELPVGLGDKLLLRLAAHKLGLRKTATFPKRALQFGSRIADRKQNGADLSKYLSSVSNCTD